MVYVPAGIQLLVANSEQQAGHYHRNDSDVAQCKLIVSTSILIVM